MRIAIGIEYDGSGFAGWQWQKAQRTVQAVIEDALGRVAAEPIRLHCSGRTDAGVHAQHQIAHFDTAAQRPTRAWVMGTNRDLPEDARVLWARQVPFGFHARSSAIARHYRYLILNRPMRSALMRQKATWCFYPLDEQRMQSAADHLVGEHDFSSFRAQRCQSRSPFRRMYLIKVHRHEDQVIVDLVANAFLHHMVRNIVGVLMAIGAGKAEPDWSKQVLEARSRSLAGVTAAPDGLYFAGILYPTAFDLPQAPIFSCLPPGLGRFKQTSVDDGISLAANSR
jgi:tRNA pseudouridine38-40 synthase